MDDGIIISYVRITTVREKDYINISIHILKIEIEHLILIYNLSAYIYSDF